jgi:serralysin
MCTLCNLAGKASGGLGCLDGNAAGTAAGGSANGDAAKVDGSGSLFQGPGSGGDTVSGSTGTAAAMSGATAMRGYINSSGDQDWYQLTLVAGQTYTFAENGFGVGALRDPYLRLFNASGTQVAGGDATDDTGPLLGSLLSYTPTASGTYYVSAGAFASGTGQYILTMNAGATPYLPVVAVGDAADYLTNSYWEVNGIAAREWGTASVTYNVTGLEPERAALARIAFESWADVANLTFVETTGSAQITLDDGTSGSAYSSSSTSGGFIVSSFINVATNWYGGIDAVDSYTLQTFIHEIGHSLGLGHGGPYNGSATYGIDNVYANDSWQMSLMSYMDQVDASTGSFRFTMTPMMADVLAVQRLYGAPSTRTGDTIYGFGSTAGLVGTANLYEFSSYAQAPAFTIFDSGGTDTLNASGYGNNQLIDLRGGNFSNIGGLSANIGIYTTALIENAVGGSGHDSIIGNAANNVIRGNGGNDAIDGGDGTDSAIFSGQQSSYALTDLGNGSVRVSGLDGVDTLTNIEQLVFDDQTVNWPLSPSPDLSISGLLLVAQTLSFAVNNKGAGPAATSIAGVYLSGDGTVTTADILLTTVLISALTEAAADNESISEFTSLLPGNLTPGTYYLGILADYNSQIAESNEADNASGGIPIILGNNSVNTLTGTSVGNVLIGLAGNDTMIGLGGNDNYYVDSSFDQVLENANEGIDTVYAGASYALSANVEYLTLMGSGNFQAIGNALANFIVGNSGNNVLDGTAGADAMAGGLGSDAYFADNASDQIIENSGEGSDAVYTAVTYMLPSNVEHIYLTGAGNHSGYGNAHANYMVGNSGHNVLDGSAGADVMVGGLGSDAYFADNAFDQIMENSGEGSDAVYAATTYMLPTNVEHIYLTGAGNLSGYGNAHANYMVGNSGHNVLDGSAGADVMVGGLGSDAYFVDDASDQIMENSGEGSDAAYTAVTYLLPSNVEHIYLLGTANLSGYGNVHANYMVGNSGNNTLDGGAGADALVGGAGNDAFTFRIGEAGGDSVADFDGGGASAGDQFVFIGYGTLAQGASFMQINATHWSISSWDGATTDIIALSNTAPVDASDFMFV